MDEVQDATGRRFTPMDRPDPSLSCVEDLAALRGMTARLADALTLADVYDFGRLGEILVRAKAEIDRILEGTPSIERH